MAVFLRDKYSKVKNQAVPLLTSVIYLTASSKMAVDLKVETTFEKFFNELGRASKHSATGDVDGCEIKYLD